MARMYARKRGKSGSKKPSISPQWVDFVPKEIETIAAKLRKQGLDTASIGRAMRDQYGIPSAKMLTGKRILKILKENNAAPHIPEDLMSLLKRSVKLHVHMKTYKKDSTSKHGLELMESKIRRLAKYYRKKNKLPADCAYDSERAKLITQKGG